MLEKVSASSVFEYLWLNIYSVIALGLPIIIITKNCFFNEEKYRKTVPGLACSQFGLLVSFIKGVGKKKHLKNDEILCVLFDVLCGLCKMFEKEGIFTIHISIRPFIFIYKPEIAENIFSSSTLIEKPDGYHVLRSWLGTGMLTSGGKKWRHRRKLLTPTFHFRILDEFLPIFNEQSNILISKLRKYEGFIDIVPLVTTCALDIIAETAMGVSINAQGDTRTEYITAVYEITNGVLMRIVRPWLYYDFIFNWTTAGKQLNHHLKIVHDFTRQVIREKKAALLKQQQGTEHKEETSSLETKKRTAFLELLLNYHLTDPSFTEEDIKEEVDTFMFAGHDTTSMATSFALWLIGLDENVQRLVHEELDEIFMDDRNREITRTDLSRMKYLDCVIKETLRLYPTVPVFGREITETFKLGDYSIKKGTYCIVAPIALHRDANSFPNPEKFDPERFFPENTADRHPYAYVPFSAGPRNCIGQRYALTEAKTVLANILRNFNVTSKDQRDRVRIVPNIVINSIDPLLMHFSPRS